MNILKMADGGINAYVSLLCIGFDTNNSCYLRGPQSSMAIIVGERR